MSLLDRWRHQLAELREAGRLRTLTPAVGIDFSSNDYLGYGKRAWPPHDLSRSGAASRLLRGQHPIWDEVETRLAAWHRAEAALVFTSGYAANEGLLGAVIERGDVVFSDECNHASIIDGLRLSGAEKVIFRHNDVNELEARMRARLPARFGRQAWFVVTASLFGMEGDTAPLRQLAELVERYQAQLIVDEAHATGCFGHEGGGMVDTLGLRGQVLASIHTGGKALAVPGAYLVGSQLLKDLLVNRCRHFIFTTALPPQVGAWWLDALALVARDKAARTILHDRAMFFRADMLERGIAVGGTHYIASIVLGPDALAVEAARRLQDAGFDVRAIRPPSVPVGTARLRISVHADHDPPALRQLAEALALVVPSIT
jgi:8-amino-7-oxononanoate synthase